MSAEEYRAYLTFAVKDYAEEGVKSNMWSEADALQKAEAQYQALLPQAQDTPNHSLYSLLDAEQNVGMLWVMTHGEGKQRHTFIYDIRIDEAFQGQGYGTQAIEHLKTLAREQSAHSIKLHVFGHNYGAIRLYEKLGFVATNINMKLDLD